MQPLAFDGGGNPTGFGTTLNIARTDTNLTRLQSLSPAPAPSPAPARGYAGSAAFGGLTRGAGGGAGRIIRMNAKAGAGQARRTLASWARRGDGGKRTAKVVDHWGWGTKWAL